MRGKKTIIAIAVTAAAAFAGPADASVAPTCRVATVGGDYVASVCFEFNAGLSGTTVSPSLYVAGCAYDPALCNAGETTYVGKTGFVVSHGIRGLEIDTASGSVKWDGGTLGTAYINGKGKPVSVPGFCVGTVAFCGSLVVIG
jgi:hypothetical protein